MKIPAGWKMLGKIHAFLCVGEAERDEGFRGLIEALSRSGVRVIWLVEIVAPVVLLLPQFLLVPDRSSWMLRAGNAAVMVTIGLLTWLAARFKPLGISHRLLGALSGWAGGVSMITFALLLAGIGPGYSHYIPWHITAVLLVTVGVLPLCPVHTLGLGLALWGYYEMAGYVAVRWGIVTVVDPDRVQALFILMAASVSTALSALLYKERLASYRSHVEALKASENLCQTQSRLLLSQNAASLGRLAAALSHELNSPLGALRNSVDTLLLLGARQATSPPEEHRRLVSLQAELRRSISESAARLQQMVARLQRFTNLDNAEVLPADINAMVSDVIALLGPDVQDRVQLELDLQPVAPLLCRPQQLSAVLSNLLQNAVEASSNGHGRVHVTTRDSGSQLELRIRDNGRGLRSEELASIFDPGFKVTGGRVGTGNWSLFSARQIVRQHGGDISIESAEGQGTVVSVTLPRLSESELD